MYNDSEMQPPAIAQNGNHTSFCELTITHPQKKI